MAIAGCGENVAEARARECLERPGGRVVLIAMASHVKLWGWFFYPANFYGMLAIDLVIGWTLAGLVISGIVKEPAED